MFWIMVWEVYRGIKDKKGRFIFVVCLLRVKG